MWNKLKEVLRGVEEKTDSDEFKKQINETKESINKLEGIEDRFILSNRLQKHSKTGNEETLLERMNHIGIETIGKERVKRYQEYFENGIKEDDWLEIYKKESSYYYFQNEDVVPYSQEDNEVDWDVFHRVISFFDKEYEKIWIKIKTNELSFSSEDRYLIDFQKMELKIFLNNYDERGRKTEQDSFYWVNIDRDRVWYFKEKYHRRRTSLIDDNDERFDDSDFEGLWSEYLVYEPLEWLKYIDDREYTKENGNQVLRWNKVDDFRNILLLGMMVDWVTVTEDWEKWESFKKEFPNHQFQSTDFFKFR